MSSLLEEFEETSLQDFINSIELPYTGKFNENSYSLVVKTSNDFSNLYNFLSKLDGFHVEDNPVADNDTAAFVFTNGEFEAKLTGDFNKDFYRLEVTRV